MKSNITYFIAGVMTCLIAITFFWQLTNPFNAKYNFGDIDKSARFANFLDERDILYSYEIDHLKRHWIRPHIKDDKNVREAFELADKSQ